MNPNQNVLASNPFKVLSPEGMNAKDAVDLFVEVSELRKIYSEGHTMLHGPRGSGKSMLFRYLMPDCQMAAKEKEMQNLDFFGVLVSIKNTALNLTELRKLAKGMARSVLSEHALCSFVASSLFRTMRRVLPENCPRSWTNPSREIVESLKELLRESGYAQTPVDQKTTPVDDARGALDACVQLCDDVYTQFNQYAKRTLFPGSSMEYEGALCDYLTFLVPMMEELRNLPYFPTKAPVYLLLDDADYLTLDQTLVLNSWLSTRTQNLVSIKVSTQHNYKTFSTYGGHQIRSPHDFQEIDISNIYTTRRTSYSDNVRDIFSKRLQKAGIGVSLDEFFPCDEKQEKRIDEIKIELSSKWAQQKGRGYRASDDVVRYARPNFMKELAGASKSASTYSYAGLDQLIHLSSGQVRYALHPAALMYDEAKGATVGEKPSHISPGIQDRVLKECADELIYKGFDNLSRTPLQALPAGGAEAVSDHQKRVEQLQNLIQFLGGLFREKLLSDDAERRVFSVAMSGGPDPDVENVFELGVQNGYFHRASIGNKEGTGRIKRYVLTRRLAPFFKLDPSSFAGYQFITNEVLRAAMRDPQRVLSAVKRKGIEEVVESHQLELFEKGDE